jgi:hypothetical protein
MGSDSASSLSRETPPPVRAGEASITTKAGRRDRSGLLFLTRFAFDSPDPSEHPESPFDLECAVPGGCQIAYP